MASASPTKGSTSELPWHITSRWQELEGETRANVLRLIAVVVFYAAELASYHGLHFGPLEIPAASEITRTLHRGVTYVVIGWILVGLAVQFTLARRYFPSYLKYATTLVDLALLTSILMLGTGPKSPMVAGYFVVIGLAAQRFSLPLIWVSTGGAILGYLGVCGNARLYQKVDFMVPRYHQLLVIVSLVMVGITLGQVIRRVRRIAEQYHARLAGQAAREDRTDVAKSGEKAHGVSSDAR